MNRIIIYKTRTGFSERYAKSLATDLDIKVISFKESKKMNLSSFDEIIFTTSIFGNMLLGLNDFLKKQIKNITVLAVGFTPMSDEYVNTLKESNNFTGNLFYVRGGINYEKLGLFSKMILKKVTKQPESIDLFDEKNLDNIKEYLKAE